MEKINNTIYASTDDLLFMFGAALRYGLGRRTYATSLISGVIEDNISLINEKWFINFIRDINNYENDRLKWNNNFQFDDTCDYESWTNLKQKLICEYINRKYKHPLSHYSISETAMKLFVIKKNKRQYVDTCTTLRGALSLIFDFCKEHNLDGFTYKSSEKIISLHLILIKSRNPLN